MGRIVEFARDREDGIAARARDDVIERRQPFGAAFESDRGGDVRELVAIQAEISGCAGIQAGGIAGEERMARADQ